MEWISFKEQEPKKGEFVLLVRNSYPSFFWMGIYEPKERQDWTDVAEYYIKLPNLPV